MYVGACIKYIYVHCMYLWCGLCVSIVRAWCMCVCCVYCACVESLFACVCVCVCVCVRARVRVCLACMCASKYTPVARTPDSLRYVPVRATVTTLVDTYHMFSLQVLDR